MSSDDTTDDQASEVSLSVSTLGNGETMDKARETTQLDERRISIDAGLGIKPPYDPETLAAFQEINETHQACVRKKARYEVGYGFEIVPHPQADDPDPDGDDHDAVETFWHGATSSWQIGPQGTAASTPEEVLELARQDYHGIGWAALEILVEGDGTPTGLAHVPATTVRVRKTTKKIETEDGEEKEVIQSGHGYLQVRQGRRRYFAEAGDRYRGQGEDDDREPIFVDKETGKTASSADELKNEPANELIFIPNPSPLSLYYGIPDWVAAMQTMGADQAAKEWNHDLFDHHGIPYYVVKVTGGTLTEDSKDELRDLMDNLKGTRYRTAILEVEEFQQETDLTGEDGNDIEIELVPVGSREDLDMEFQQFRERNEHEIAKVHAVPPILINVTDTSNRSNSKEQVREFAEDVIAPEQKKFEARLYKILHQTALGVDNWTIEFELRGADRPEKNARVARNRVDAAGRAVTIDEAREAAGWDPLPDDHPVDGSTLLAELGGRQGPPGADEPTVEEQLPPDENKIGERDWSEVETDLDVVGGVATKDPIEQTQFSSSNLAEGLYDFETRECYISFKRGEGQNSLYAYVDVPAAVWEALNSAGSAGSYHYENVRLEYGYVEITNHHDRLPEGPSPDSDDVPDDIPL
ncbi:phage portal protein [Natrinema salaciae]|uniref:Phage portal protein, HK97 family/phage portal protein, PBSX family,TIGR01540 n=1 Tax=Natrinema salaciae TaxID=1186196 RepID=A0A1H9EZX4_9EURY|nr:phage portal protein [Natrinema salaciae]SEQ31191.1 phage portal protein, HK97 family/phage portal protein, PBSX family,TIGR01540 [Natrinema salaciae]